MSKPVLGFLVSRIFGVPLLLTEAKLHEILKVLGPRVNMDITNIQELDLKTSLKSPKTANITYTVDPDGVATIPIHGTLVHRSQGINALSGLTSYAQIRADFDSAMANTNVETILLDIDSHGGEVAGLFDLVDTIYSARGTKPITAIIDESGYSAAYAIASAADRIYLSRTAGVGSIGVVMVHADYSEKEKQAGVKYTVVYAGERKTDLSPHAPLSKEAHAAAQKFVDATYALFVSTVARNNGLSESDIINTQAAMYQGQDAVDVGLADAVLSYEEANNLVKGGKPKMPTRNATNEQLEQAANAAKIAQETGTVTAGTEQLATPPEAPFTPVVQTPIPTPASAPTPAATTPLDATTITKAERDRVLEIIECCTIVGHQELSVDLIANGSSADTARKMILSVMAAQSDQDQVVSTVNPARSGEQNPLLADARKRAAEVAA